MEMNTYRDIPLDLGVLGQMPATVTVFDRLILRVELEIISMVKIDVRLLLSDEECKRIQEKIQAKKTQETDR